MFLSEIQVLLGVLYFYLLNLAALRQTHTYTQNNEQEELPGLALSMQLILNLIYCSFSVFFQLNSRGFLDEIKPCSSIKGQC